MLRLRAVQGLGQRHDDALRPSQRAQTVRLAVLRDLADQGSSVVATQTADDLVEVPDLDQDGAPAQLLRLIARGALPGRGGGGLG